MNNDPACLFYIGDWLKSTAEMHADCRGWYLNLILHQYDKGDLPTDIEELANLANVRISEYKRFKQVFEQVLKQKFELNENGRLENEKAKIILQKRELFKAKRSDAGKISYCVKFIRSNISTDENFIFYAKNNIILEDIDIKNEQVLKQMFKQMFKLYKNEDENENKKEDGDKKPELIYPFNTKNFIKHWDLWKQYRFEQHKFKYKGTISEQAALKSLSELAKDEIEAIKIILQSMGGSYKGFFALKNNKHGQKGNISKEFIQGLADDLQDG